MTRVENENKHSYTVTTSQNAEGCIFHMHACERDFSLTPYHSQLADLLVALSPEAGDYTRAVETVVD
jgi:hypothetical protein